MWYNINFNKIIVDWLPVLLRKSFHVVWLQSFVSPLTTMLYDFKAFKKRTDYNLAHNGQVCYLRKVLNDAFDSTLRRITISDSSIYEPVYVYTNAEDKPTFLPMVLRQKSEYHTSTDFVVGVPRDLVFNMDDMAAKINYYKLFSKRFQIQLK